MISYTIFLKTISKVAPNLCLPCSLILVYEWMYYHCVYHCGSHLPFLPECSVHGHNDKLSFTSLVKSSFTLSMASPDSEDIVILPCGLEFLVDILNIYFHSEKHGWHLPTWTKVFQDNTKINGFPKHWPTVVLIFTPLLSIISKFGNEEENLAKVLMLWWPCVQRQANHHGMILIMRKVMFSHLFQML